jgi:hypothetical protein
MLRSYSEDSITERALEAYSQIEEPRLREVMAALIRHLHAPAPWGQTDLEFIILFFGSLGSGSLGSDRFRIYYFIFRPRTGT